MTDDLIAWTAAEIAADEWKTHGLQDVRIGVTREGLAQTKRRLAERIVKHVLDSISHADLCERELAKRRAVDAHVLRVISAGPRDTADYRA